MDGMSIGEMVKQTGIPEGTLRMWERRHGFPQPRRSKSGHRRYSEQEVELVRRVAAGREAGLSLSAAIERAGREQSSSGGSLFASLCRRRPELAPQPVAKRVMIAFSHAIEDEALARAEHHLLFGAFQRRRFYRREQARWRELAQGAELAVVFADFERVARPPGRPVEVPVDRSRPLAREWVIAYEGESSAACLIGREPPHSRVGARTAERAFEVVWSVEPDVVHDAVRLCAAFAREALPNISEALENRLRSEPAAATRDQLRLAAAVMRRTLAYLP
jgi:MerR family transcriptional regulator, light-induced transcriptional regulator